MRAAALLLTLLAIAPVAAHADAPPPARSPDDVLRALLDGNHSFVAAGAICNRQSPARRSEVAATQRPVAVVVGCADSRVPPEAIFSQGIGDLFVVRVAGNVIDDDVLGSIEYAVDHLGVSLVVVLGHERCGAVAAAIAPEAAPAHVDAIVKKIRAGLADAGTRTQGTQATQPDALDRAVRVNVAASVRAVQTSAPILAPLVQKGRVKVVGARYDLDTGAVEIVR